MSHHSDHVPAARVVRQGSVTIPRPRVPLRARVDGVLQPAIPAARAVLVHVVGLWPIWAVAALAVAFLWAAGLHGSP